MAFSGVLPVFWNPCHSFLATNTSSPAFTVGRQVHPLTFPDVEHLFRVRMPVQLMTAVARSKRTLS
jgi:hypothetical protein